METTKNETESVNLSLNDLAMAVRIIDVCTERGAFKGEELSAIGTVRGNLARFVKANTPENEDESEEGDVDNDSSTTE